MRIAILSADFGLFFLLCIYLVHSGTTAELTTEPCIPENCLSSSDKCLEVSNRLCKNRGDSCCSVVKTEYATLCKQHGGICRSDFCGEKLQRRATDCDKDQVCCVLLA